jgi:glycosyltransferase involved in cell wall biosynthesis
MVKATHMKLSILIATTKQRVEMFEELLHEFDRQLIALNEPMQSFGSALNDLITRTTESVELIALSDNKEISIGDKRQRLLELARGEFIVYFDDDDMPSKNYVRIILNAITPDIDCIGMNVIMTTNGVKQQRCCHRLLSKVWANRVEGWDYVRNITHFNPVLRSVALRVGFKDLRFGEDKLYSDGVSALLTKEAYITEPLFHYRYTNTTKHNEKYGIK